MQSRLTVAKSRRYYNDPGRILPGAIFYCKDGERHVMTGQMNHGRYLLAHECGNKSFRRKDVRIYPATGLVYMQTDEIHPATYRSGVLSPNLIKRKEKLMLKINKSEFIKESDIECVCDYGSKPLQQIAKRSREMGKFREMMGRNGLKSMIILEDGYLFLCPYKPDTYIGKCREEDFLAVSTRCYIRKAMIREICTKLNTGQQRELKEKKGNGEYVNLTYGKSTSHYLFMKAGRIYGIHMAGNGFIDAIG